jgi:lipopolysaccharide transport system permease protein
LRLFSKKQVRTSLKNGLLSRKWLSNFRVWRSWLNLGLNDLTVKYSRTRLGFLWSVLPLLFFATCLFYVFNFQSNALSSRSFLQIYFGLAVWNYVASSILEGLSLFSTSRPYILNSDLPLSFYALRLATKLFLHFVATVLLGIAMSIIFFNRLESSWLIFTALLPLIALLGLFTCYIFGFLNVTFPDLGQFVPPGLQVVFILTPIFWDKSFLDEREWIYFLNPFYWIVECLRLPLVGDVISMEYFAITAGIMILAAITALSVTKSAQKVVPLRI